MSNLLTARAGIVAEIASHHASIASLEKALESLDALIGERADAASAAKAPGKRGRKPKVVVVEAQATKAPAKVAKSSKAKAAKASPKIKTAAKPKAAKKAKTDGGLPFTGGDYWFNLITSEPQTAPEILQKAVDALGFAPSKEQRTKLQNRQTFALATLVKTNRIKDSGTGRDHCYFTA
jgi:hypothetical protein